MLAPAIALLLAAAQLSGIGCPVPALSAPSGADVFARRFGGNTTAFKGVSNNLAAAFRSACGAGLVERGGPLGFGGESAVQFALKNAPEANVASVYAERLANRNREVVLEYPFITPDGSVNIPTAEEIEEAIFCAVRGASAKEQEESGRCLPD